MVDGTSTAIALKQLLRAGFGGQGSHRKLARPGQP